MTLSATELRIGNWARIAPNEEDVMDDDYHNDYITSAHIREIDLNELLCLGIPLTEEWLIRFGFENNKLRIGVYDLVVVLPNSAFYNSVGFPCKHVHQLQNLYFVLTGQELILTNQ